MQRILLSINTLVLILIAANLLNFGGIAEEPMLSVSLFFLGLSAIFAVEKLATNLKEILLPAGIAVLLGLFLGGKILLGSICLSSPAIAGIVRRIVRE